MPFGLENIPTVAAHADEAIVSTRFRAASSADVRARTISASRMTTAEDAVSAKRPSSMTTIATSTSTSVNPAGEDERRVGLTKRGRMRRM